jgi:hypothetical protein
MPSIDVKKRQIRSKIVYCGPGRSGKTEVLKYVYRSLPEGRGRFREVPVESEPGLKISVLTARIGSIFDFAAVFHLCSGPGQATAVKVRRGLLRDTDGIVFVADCDPRRRMANVDALSELRENLEAIGLSLQTVPHVIQYNKAELPNRTPVGELRAELNPYGAPDFETSVVEGRGILPALRAIVNAVKQDLKARL